jgi:hypothetical protein
VSSIDFTRVKRLLVRICLPGLLIGTSREHSSAFPVQGLRPALATPASKRSLSFLLLRKLKINPDRDIDDTIIGVQRKDLL